MPQLDRRLDARQRGALASTLSANMLVFYDATAVVVALPHIGATFPSGADDLQWVITSYLLALAVFMVLAGRVADRWGSRRAFLGGLTVFGLASAACAAAPTLWLLLAARFVQGLGGAVMVPLALSITTGAVTPQRRGWAIGLLSTAGTSLLVLGPVAGGALVAVDWRLLFLANLPVVAFSAVAAIRYIDGSRTALPHPTDWRMVALLLFGLTGLVVGLVEIADLGPLAVAPLAAGLLALGVFVRKERHLPRPLLDFALLRDPMLGPSLAALFAIQFAVFGITLSLSLYLQHGLGLDAVRSGLVIAAAGVGTPLLSVVTGRLADRHGPRALVLPGLVLAAAGLAAAGSLAWYGSVVALLPGLLVFALARPMVFTPAGVGAFLSHAGTQRALAASLATESRQLGAVFGVAVSTTAFTVVHGSVLTGQDSGLAGGFAAAMLTASAACAAAAVAVWWWMPRR